VEFYVRNWASFAYNREPRHCDPTSSPARRGQTQIDIAKLLVDAPVIPGAPSLREIWAADITLLLTDEASVQTTQGTLPICGLADGGAIGIWLGAGRSFQPDSEGVDLRGSEDAWFALVATAASAVPCNLLKNGSAHEIGHLMGGGHWATPNPGTEPLNSNGRADRKLVYQTFPSYGIQTARTALSGPNACVSFSNCPEVTTYSSPSFYGISSRQNVQTIAQTAKSVANYYRGDPIPSPAVPQCSDGMDNDGDGGIDSADPDCDGPTDEDETGPPPPPMPPSCNPISFPPTNVSASLAQVCDPSLTFSTYRLRWKDACPGDNYLIEANQGAGTFTVGTVFGFSANLIISGSPGAITVRSCVGFSCSVQSNPPVFIFDQC